LATTPKGFPLTWSGRVHAALTLRVDPAGIVAESQQQLNALSAQSEQLPPRLVSKGLPVPLAEVVGLRSFELRLAHVALPQGSAVGSFARATARYAQFRFYANFAFAWEAIANQVAASVADGGYVPSFRDYQDFVQNRQQILHDLPARARDRLAMSEEELMAIQRDSLGLGDAALVAGMTSGLVGLLGVISGWDAGSRLFGTALGGADALVAAAGDGERISMAVAWILDAGYAGAAAAGALDGLIAAGPAMLKALAVIVVLQMIPYVNVAVDLVLMVQLGADVVSLLGEFGLAFSDVSGARTVVDLQRAAGRLARVLAAGGMQILTLLVTMGLAKGVTALRARSARIHAANPALSEEEAMRRAMRDAPAADRAPLEATVDPWERSLNQETQELLRDRPDLRRVFKEMDPRVRQILTRCASLCIPANATTAEAIRIHQFLVRMRTLQTADELVLNEYFHAGRNDLAGAIASVERASGPGHLRRLLREAAAERSSAPKVLAPLADPPGHGFPGRWGDPDSPSYGHSVGEHGAQLEPSDFRNRAMSKRASGRRVPDSQFYDNALIVEAEQRAPATPGEHLVEMFRPIGRVFDTQGGVVSDVQRIIVVRNSDGTIKTSYPTTR
jgi:hypothetical protein